MIKLLFILAFFPLVWANESANPQENAPENDSDGLLIICDLQGALFFPKAANQKVATIQNAEIAQQLKAHHQRGAKLLYMAEHQVEIMFWQNSIKARDLPLEAKFSLSNEIFHGFENSLPSCRLGVVLCQGQPLGETLGIVINQLWIWTQFNPKKILFYTSDKQRGEMVTVIGNRMGVAVEVKLVNGIIGTPPVMPLKKPTLAKPKKAKHQQTKPQLLVKPVEKPIRKPANPKQDSEQPSAKPPKVMVITQDAEIKQPLAPIKIDESKLETV